MPKQQIITIKPVSTLVDKIKDGSHDQGRHQRAAHNISGASDVERTA